MVVAFFGHKDTPSAVRPLLEQTVQRLIEENEDITFLVGTHGAFDLMAQSVLEPALHKYPHIACYIVLSYIPVERNSEQNALPTLVPEGIESVPKRFAICSATIIWSMSATPLCAILRTIGAELRSL